MAVYAEGMPCWADVTLDDVEAGKRFYGELFGWTFEDPGIDDRARTGWSGSSGQTAFVNALRDGRKVAALAPKSDGRMPTAWGVYFATDDVVALARRIGEAGGQMVTDPLPVPPLGVTAAAADPGGAVFGLWQAGRHAGFELRDRPGAFCWTEVYARDKARTDPFYETVFGFQGFDLDEEGEDFRTWSPAGADPGPGTAIGGRSVMGNAFPAEMPDHFLVYFVVDDCDGAAAKAVDLGGRVQAEPFDTPYGRIAVLTDNQGATFAVLAEPAEASAASPDAAHASRPADTPDAADTPADTPDTPEPAESPAPTGPAGPSAPAEPSRPAEAPKPPGAAGSAEASERPAGAGSGEGSEPADLAETSEVEWPAAPDDPRESAT